jgi:hypothetical protein
MPNDTDLDFTLDSLPRPEDVSVDARAVVIACLEIARELRANRESMENSPGTKMAELALMQFKAQTGGIVPGIFKPGH